MVLDAQESDVQKKKKTEMYMFSRSEIYGYSDAFPARSYLNLLVGPAPKSGDFAFARTRVELGLGFNNFEISAIHRNDYNLTFSPDVADFTYRRKNRVRVQPGDDFVVDVRANQYQVSGAKLAYKMSLHDTFTLKLAYSHLTSTEIVSGYMGQTPEGEGGLVSISIEELPDGRRFERLQGLVYTDYYYTDDPFFNRAVDEPAGRGYAVDVGFEWQVNDKLLVVGQVDDLAGELKWNNIGRTTATATSAIREFNEEGFTDILPNFEGNETFADFTQSLTRRESLSFIYDWRTSWQFGYDYISYPEIALHNFSVAYEWAPNWSVAFAIEPQTSGKSLGLNTPVGDMYFIFDTLDFDQARTLGFGWSFAFLF